MNPANHKPLYLNSISLTLDAKLETLSPISLSPEFPPSTDKTLSTQRLQKGNVEGLKSGLKGALTLNPKPTRRSEMQRASSSH